MLSTILRAAQSGDQEAADWLKGKGYIHITHTEPFKSIFVYYGSNPERYTANAVMWRRTVFERDDYTCQECGAQGEINAHHIKEWSKYPSLRFDASNGITLCFKCHAKKHPHINFFKSKKGSGDAKSRQVHS
jgi:hypothetical protein